MIYSSSCKRVKTNDRLSFLFPFAVSLYDPNRTFYLYKDLKNNVAIKQHTKNQNTNITTTCYNKEVTSSRAN
jgi:hypothetical protein